MPMSVKETSGQATFPLLYEACDSSADMALTDLPGRRRIGREGGILHNKKRYPSKLCPHGHCISIHLQRLHFRQSRLATMGYKEWLVASAVTPLTG